MKSIGQIDMNNLSTYNFIGFGSRIYFFKHHKNLLKFAFRLPQLKNKKGIHFLYEWNNLDESPDQAWIT